LNEERDIRNFGLLGIKYKAGPLGRPGSRVPRVTRSSKKKRRRYTDMKLRTILLLLTMGRAMALLVGGGGTPAMAADQPKGTSTTSNSSSAPRDSSESSSLSAQASRIITKTFSNSSPILIPGDLRARTGRGSPYPSKIEVSGFSKGLLDPGRLHTFLLRALST
jgi:hypothetical protein